jgi:hypothetical protein
MYLNLIPSVDRYLRESHFDQTQHGDAWAANRGACVVAVVVATLGPSMLFLLFQVVNW